MITTTVFQSLTAPQIYELLHAEYASAAQRLNGDNTNILSLVKDVESCESSIRLLCAQNLPQEDLDVEKEESEETLRKEKERYAKILDGFRISIANAWKLHVKLKEAVKLFTRPPVDPQTLKAIQFSAPDLCNRILTIQQNLSTQQETLGNYSNQMKKLHGKVSKNITTLQSSLKRFFSLANQGKSLSYYQMLKETTQSRSAFATTQPYQGESDLGAEEGLFRVEGSSGVAFSTSTYTSLYPTLRPPPSAPSYLPHLSQGGFTTPSSGTYTYPSQNMYAPSSFGTQPGLSSYSYPPPPTSHSHPQSFKSTHASSLSPPDQLPHSSRTPSPTQFAMPSLPPGSSRSHPQRNPSRIHSSTYLPLSLRPSPSNPNSRSTSSGSNKSTSSSNQPGASKKRVKLIPIPVNEEKERENPSTRSVVKKVSTPREFERLREDISREQIAVPEQVGSDSEGSDTSNEGNEDNLDNVQVAQQGQNQQQDRNYCGPRCC